ncbi:esterase FE4-like [Planococcus citri]|uniref:esterase FE4-like n=1 Tax=Planococcus citri TaxID=170843 RepID=UPI0031F7B306
MASYVTIPFKDSEIRGIEKTSLNEKIYYAFLGIPYAEPPIGDLRFKAPQPLKNFPKYLDATKFKSSCIQYNELHKLDMGSEDCLHVNIFIPKLPTTDSLSPVMLYFHGGSYLCLTANSMTPHLLIEHDIVIVSFNFRLHALGFLDLGIPDCPGNVGLKDQVLALQWVKENIKYFGGDPDNITLFGMSSGAASAHMLIMSPMHQNLANKLILIGSNALNTWHVNPEPLKIAFELGRKFGYEGDDKEALLKLLKSVSAEEILKAVLTIYKENIKLPRSYSFRPTVECIKEGAFLPDLPQKLWREVNNITVINGINENEGTVILRNPEFAQLIVQHDALKNVIFDMTSVKEDFLESMFQEIISFYGIAEKDNPENYVARVNLLTDLLLRHVYTIPEFLPSISSTCSLYNYQFAYRGTRNIMTNAWKERIPQNIIEGTFHADDVGYLVIQKKWNTPESDRKVAQTVCTLWTNFVKYGNPNGEIFNNLWVPSSKENPCYLQIDENLTMKNEDFNLERANFWKHLTEKYSL